MAVPVPIAAPITEDESNRQIQFAAILLKLAALDNKHPLHNQALISLQPFLVYTSNLPMTSGAMALGSNGSTNATAPVAVAANAAAAPITVAAAAASATAAPAVTTPTAAFTTVANAKASGEAKCAEESNAKLKTRSHQSSPYQYKDPIHKGPLFFSVQISPCDQSLECVDPLCPKIHGTFAPAQEKVFDLKRTMPKRRVPRVSNGFVPMQKYGPTLCFAFMKHGSCRDGDNCDYRHLIEDPSKPFTPAQRALIAFAKKSTRQTPKVPSASSTVITVQL